MKLNWKYFIIGLNAVIVIGMLGMVFYSFSRKNELVEPDYYAKSIKYQKQVDKINRTNTLPEKITIEANDKGVIVNFPKAFLNSAPIGKITMFRPSASSMDFSLPLQTDGEGRQLITLDNNHKGFWKLMLEWNMGGNDYYFEDEILVK